jgi:hypothetical protein
MLQGSDVINNRLSAYTGDSRYKYLYVRALLLNMHIYMQRGLALCTVGYSRRLRGWSRAPITGLNLLPH